MMKLTNNNIKVLNNSTNLMKSSPLKYTQNQAD
jgi:hypothetical protein